MSNVNLAEKFTPSPTTLVRFVDDAGIVRELHLNRKQRQQMKLKKVNLA